MTKEIQLKHNSIECTAIGTKYSHIVFCHAINGTKLLAEFLLMNHHSLQRNEQLKLVRLPHINVRIKKKKIH